MMKINLLPWRAEERIRQKQQLKLASVLILVATILIIIGMHSLLSLSNSSDSQQLLTSEIESVNAEIIRLASTTREKRELEKKLKAISQIETDQNRIMTLIKTLEETTPEEIELQKVASNDNEVNLSGNSPTNTKITQFFDALSKNGYLKNIILKESKIEVGGETQKITFAITANYIQPNTDNTDVNAVNGK